MSVKSVILWVVFLLTAPYLLLAIISPESVVPWWSEMWQTVRAAMWVAAFCFVSGVILLLSAFASRRSDQAPEHDHGSDERITVETHYHIENVYIADPKGEYGHLFEQKGAVRRLK